MRMKNIALRQVDPERDFGEIGNLFLLEQGELALETDLMVDYEIHKERIFCLTIAENEHGELMGFNWATRSRFDANQAYFFIIVNPEHCKHGVGRLLYENVEQAAIRNNIKQLEINVRDSCLECRAFAERCGFVEEAHDIELALDLNVFDEQPYNEIITRLKSEGFQFTSMEALGNTEEAQRKLYFLNDSTSMERVVPEDEHSWLSFEEFQKKVCQTDWYKPAGQMVVIDTITGN
jgi:GNAT superfamily N-acetyltransferase